MDEYVRVDNLEVSDYVTVWDCNCSEYGKQTVMAVDDLQYLPTADVVEVVRCKDCKLSSEPKAVSRYELYCNNYDVRFCEKEQKIVCGTHFCSYGERNQKDS